MLSTSGCPCGVGPRCDARMGMGSEVGHPQHPSTTSSKVGKMPSSPAEPGAAGPPRDTPLHPWDVEVGAPPLFQGQTRRCRLPRSALVRVSPCSLPAALWSPFPGQWDPQGAAPPGAASLPRDPSAPRDRDGHLATVPIFLGFSSLNARENSQRSLLPGVFFL